MVDIKYNKEQLANISSLLDASVANIIVSNNQVSDIMKKIEKCWNSSSGKAFIEKNSNIINEQQTIENYLAQDCDNLKKITTTYELSDRQVNKNNDELIMEKVFIY